MQNFSTHHNLSYRSRTEASFIKCWSWSRVSNQESTPSASADSLIVAYRNTLVLSIDALSSSQFLVLYHKYSVTFLNSVSGKDYC